MVLIAAFAIVAVVLLPHVISRREAITQSREFDRFSPRMRVLRTDDTAHASEECGPIQMRLLPTPPTSSAELPGAQMSTYTERTRRPGARTRTSGDTPERRIAQLRARRAARLANERAAAQRRMVASAASGVLTLLVVVLGVLGLVSWPWVLLPAAVFASAMVLSRTAAIRSERVESEEEAHLVELRAARNAGLSRATRLAAPTVAAARTRAGLVATDGPDASADTMPEASSAVRDGSSASAEVGPAVADATSTEQSGEAPEGDAPARPAEIGTTRTPSSGERAAAVERRTWTPTRVPAPSWSQRERVAGRIVHADTDLRGIPRVGAAPARPSTTEGMPEGSRSTEQVVASQPIAFDLDEVLDHRRAE